MPPIRAFIAIELPEELKSKLSTFITKLRAEATASIKWVNPSGIHLTLKFLGNISSDAVPTIIAATQKAAQGTPPFRLHTEQTGVFPNLQRAQVAWVGLGGDTEILARLQHCLESNLEALGFAPEGRRFTPHLTLARFGRQLPPPVRRNLGELICQASFVPTVITVTALSLMQSQLNRTGAIYTRLASVRLSDSLR